MSRQLLVVRQRRSELLACIASQREQMSEIAVHWKAPLALVDRGVAVARYLRSNPVLVVGVAALLVVRRRGLVGLGMALWKGWRLYRHAKSFSSKPVDHR